MSHTGRGGSWRIELEALGDYKGHTCGENQSFDPMARNFIYGFKTREQAVSYCMKLGWAYDVEVPHKRKHTTKSYADNFKWKGPPKDATA
jgi:NADH dehydrogenase (ubiquinone) Fe-S protein 4